MRLLLLACLAAAAGAYEKPSDDWQLQMGTPVGPEEAAALREEVREMARGPVKGITPLARRLTLCSRSFHSLTTAICCMPFRATSFGR